MSKRIELNVSDELFAEVERLRGDVSRQRWLLRAVERAVGVLESSGGVKAQGIARSAVAKQVDGPAPPRVSPSVALRDTWSR